MLVPRTSPSKALMSGQYRRWRRASGLGHLFNM
jgi:hypothetical protein